MSPEHFQVEGLNLTFHYYTTKRLCRGVYEEPGSYQIPIIVTEVFIVFGGIAFAFATTLFITALYSVSFNGFVYFINDRSV